jgi:hypothetical protein
MIHHHTFFRLNAVFLFFTMLIRVILMRMDRLTTSLQNALNEAQSLALGHDNNQIDSVHLLLALLQQTNSVIYCVKRVFRFQVLSKP